MLSIVSALSAACAAASPPRETPGVRSIFFHPQQRIRDRLLPRDRVVTVVRNENITVFSRPGETPQQALSRELTAPPVTAIVLVLVAQANASLTDDGTWVVTRLKAVVQDAMRVASPQDTLGVGDHVEARLAGGVTTIEDVTVRADPAVVFGVNQRYLLALSERDGTGIRDLTSSLAFAVDQRDRLRPLYSYARGLSGLSISDVRDALRR